MAQGLVDRVVIVGADRIAANGDTANKIGTYRRGGAGARHHGIPFYVAAPLSTIDLAIAERRRHPDRGARCGRGARQWPGRQIAPDGVPVLQPRLRRHARPS